MFVSKLDSKTYEVWIPNNLCIAPPRLIFEELENEEVVFRNVKNTVKPILINTFVSIVFLVLVESFDNTPLSPKWLLGFCIGVALFWIVLNHILIFTTKTKVREQHKSPSI